jgi:hypothetical protein
MASQGGSGVAGHPAGRQATAHAILLFGTWGCADHSGAVPCPTHTLAGTAQTAARAARTKTDPPLYQFTVPRTPMDDARKCAALTLEW